MAAAKGGVRIDGELPARSVQIVAQADGAHGEADAEHREQEDRQHQQLMQPSGSGAPEGGSKAATGNASGRK